MWQSLLRPWTYGLVIGCAALATLLGCQMPDRLVHDNFVRIQPHVSTRADVAVIIGEPDHTLGNRWLY